MSTHEPIADRDGTSAPAGAGAPSRSAAVSAPAAGTEEATVEGAAVEDAAVETDTVETDAVEADVAAELPPRWSLGYLAKLGAVCVLVLLLVNIFVAQPFVVPSGSMENTLRPGDRLVVDKLAYQFGGTVERGDVVVFDGTDSFVPGGDNAIGLGTELRKFGAALGLAGSDGSIFVKRVIGVGGDRVTYRPGDRALTVNGVPLAESDYLHPGDTPSDVGFDVQVPPGELFVLGDHRSASSDSRDHLGDPGGGFVPVAKVIGRADWVVFPVGHWSALDTPAGFAAIAAAARGGGHGGTR
ncbi:signal peptidase I [Kitasatospora sp. GAS204B]|uniref:signal peptidase I n=1 Tax=unclassified Kitasatospora TaxID=2633591 RepID=UPI00247519BA|nr:signal peptidase I [Kitasatospora sp. GAS204B]MDH6122122.1 signal peptidase I [Kitasatospora sp. GAS204B]